MTLSWTLLPVASLHWKLTYSSFFIARPRQMSAQGETLVKPGNLTLDDARFPPKPLSDVDYMLVNSTSIALCSLCGAANHGDPNFPHNWAPLSPVRTRHPAHASACHSAPLARKIILILCTLLYSKEIFLFLPSYPTSLLTRSALSYPRAAFSERYTIVNNHFRVLPFERSGVLETTNAG